MIGRLKLSACEKTDDLEGRMVKNLLLQTDTALEWVGWPGWGGVIL